MITKSDFYIGIIILAVLFVLFIKLEYFRTTGVKDYTNKGYRATISSGYPYETKGYVLYQVKEMYCVRYCNSVGVWKKGMFYRWELTLLPG